MNRRQLQPYPGLRAFERYEARIFFGRQQQVDELLQRLKRHHFLAVLGASGSGKSSLVKAGLLSGLEKGYMGEVGSRWSIAEMRPGEQPFLRLAEALLQDQGFCEVWRCPEERKNEQQQAFLAAELRRGSRSLSELLHNSPLPKGRRLLVLVDQFEEIFRFHDYAEDQAAAFVALLLKAAQHPDIYIVMTMRSDFLGDATEFYGLPEAINQGLYLTPRLTREQLREAIALPAQLFDGKVEAALVNHLLNEAGNDPDQLPLLQHALMRLWQRDNDKILTLAEYRGHEGLRGTLNAHAEQAWRELEADDQAIAELMFRALTERSSEGQAIRRPLKVGELLAISGVDLPHLTRIVAVFRQAGRHFLMPPPQLTLTVDTTLDISHESLIRQWQRLQNWVDAEHEKAQMYLRLREAALRNADKQGELWQGADLALARKWRKETQPNTAWAGRYADGFAQAMAFLQASEAEEERQQALEEARRQAELNRVRRQFALAFVGLVIAVALAIWGFIERERANEEAQRAEASEQVRTEGLFNGTLTHASLLARQDDFAAARKKLNGIRNLDGEVPVSRVHARKLLAGSVDIMGGQAEQTFDDKGKSLPALTGDVAMSPDGYWLAASGERGTIALFKRESGRLVQKLVGHNAEGRSSQTTVSDIVFHPKQPWLFSGGDDGQIILWALPQADREAEILRQWQMDSKVGALALTSDGKVLASGHTDGNIRLWSVESLMLDSAAKTDQDDTSETKEATEQEQPEPLRVLQGHTKLIANGWGLAFSPDGQQLASASYDNTVRLWDWQNDEAKPKILQGIQGDFNGVTFSKNGDFLAASGDTHIIVWNTKTGQRIRELKGHQNMVFGLQFLNNNLLASASSDNTIRLWDVQTGVTRLVLQGHTATVNGLALWQEGDKSWLYSSSNDGTVKRWAGDFARQWLVDLPDAPTPNAISPDGKTVVVGLDNGSLLVYTLPDMGGKAELIYTLEDVHSNDVQRLAFNAEGSRLASGGMDSVVKVWAVNNNKEFSLSLEKTFNDHERTVHAVAFSPNGTQLATASYDGRIGLFDLEGEDKILFEAHDGYVSAISFDNLAKRLLSSGHSERTLKLWDLTEQPPTSTTIASASDALLWASLSPDGSQLASVGREQTVSIYPTQGNAQALRLHGHEQAVFKAIFSPDSRQLATVSGDMTVRLWDLDTEEELFSLRLPTKVPPHPPLWDFDFRCTPSGCWIAVPLTSGKLALYHLGDIGYRH